MLEEQSPDASRGAASLQPPKTLSSPVHRADKAEGNPLFHSSRGNSHSTGSTSNATPIIDKRHSVRQQLHLPLANISLHSLHELPLRASIPTTGRCCTVGATRMQIPFRKDGTLCSDETRASPQPTKHRFALHLFTRDA